MSTTISSKCISGLDIGAEERALLGLQFDLTKLDKDTEINLCIFEVHVEGSVRYCCWAGGDLVASPKKHLALTPVGQATVQVMARLPFLKKKTPYFVQLTMGPTPLLEKILRGFRLAPPDALICFFGDLAGELDGKMGLTFNVNGMIPVEQCIGLVPAERH